MIVGLNRRVDDLDPRIRGKVVEFLNTLKSAGIEVAVIETRRSIEVQTAYFAQGRKPLAEVNALRQKAGLWLIGEAENRRKVTNTMRSKHIDGLALDIVPLNEAGLPWWNAPVALWRRIGEIGKACGLRWGGEFRTLRDRPHFEV